MPKYTIRVGEDFALKLSQLATDFDDVAEKAIRAGADIVADEMRARLEKSLSGKSTGDLEAAMGITPVLRDSNGDWNAKVGFDGYDRNGVPNQLKARVLESGSSKQQKRPFIAPAVRATRKQVQDAMEKIIEDEFEKEMRR